jgi:hypothetical protein
MPLKKWYSDKTISENISMLMHEKPAKARSKAIHTIAKEKHISEKKAKQLQAVAIALSKARDAAKKAKKKK